MSKWRFELMSDEDARKLIEARDYAADSYGDRIKARRLLERRYSDSGLTTRPLINFIRCVRCDGKGCSTCHGKGFFKGAR